MKLSETDVRLFQEAVWAIYTTHGRHDMRWREQPTPYYVLVSEIMLQQTQVARVRVKFDEFIAAFPDIESLARATQDEVVALWSGLGYNRRARFLHQAARAIVENGTFPNTLEELVKLPGIGRNTAGAILAYAFELPVAYIETNIRTVYVHHFFADVDQVDDAEILSVCEQTLVRDQPREWYWALMDYGAHLKSTGHAYNTRSRGYKKQSPLKGSVREVRGDIIRQLQKEPHSLEVLREAYGDDERLEPALHGLVRDEMIEYVDGMYRLTK